MTVTAVLTSAPATSDTSHKWPCSVVDSDASHRQEPALPVCPRLRVYARLRPQTGRSSSLDHAHEHIRTRSVNHLNLVMTRRLPTFAWQHLPSPLALKRFLNLVSRAWYPAWRHYQQGKRAILGLGTRHGRWQQLLMQALEEREVVGVRAKHSHDLQQRGRTSVSGAGPAQRGPAGPASSRLPGRRRHAASGPRSASRCPSCQRPSKGG